MDAEKLKEIEDGFQTLRMIGSAISRMDARIKKLEKALDEIIQECPNPRSPYGKEIVKIAKKALLDE